MGGHHGQRGGWSLALLLAAVAILAAMPVTDANAFQRCILFDGAFETYESLVGGYTGSTNGTQCLDGTCKTACDEQNSMEAGSCVAYLVSNCTSPCCENDYEVINGVPDNDTVCSDAGLQYWQDVFVGAKDAQDDYDDKLFFCNAETGAVLGDPHFFGFDGTPFFFDGKDDAVFNLLSEPEHQVNALFGSVGPKHGVDSTIWMLGFGVRVRDDLALALHIDADPEEIKLFRDNEARHATKMRVAMPERKFLHIELNGRHSDELLYSGRALRPAKDVLLYFPPASSINPNDATDGPLVVIKTKKFELTVMKETEDAAHLDLNVRIVGDIDRMHGVLGQTLHWTPEDAADKVKDGDLVEAPESFEVKDGLLGSSFKHGVFDHPMPPSGRVVGDVAGATALPSKALFVARSDALQKGQKGPSASRRLLDAGMGGRDLLAVMLPDSILGGPSARSEVASHLRRR